MNTNDKQRLLLLDELLLLTDPEASMELASIAAFRAAILVTAIAEPNIPPPVVVELPDIRPKVRRTIKSVSCPECKAKAGDPCLITQLRGPHGKQIGDEMSTYHRQRALKTHELNERQT